MNKACFLDRDGVINEEVNYLHEADKVVLIPGIAEGINRAHDAGYLVIVITNQAGVARGIFPEGDILLVHREIERRSTVFTTVRTIRITRASANAVSRLRG